MGFDGMRVALLPAKGAPEVIMLLRDGPFTVLLLAPLMVDDADVVLPVKSKLTSLLSAHGSDSTAGAALLSSSTLLSSSNGLCSAAAGKGERATVATGGWGGAAANDIPAKPSDISVAEARLEGFC